MPAASFLLPGVRLDLTQNLAHQPFSWGRCPLVAADRGARPGGVGAPHPVGTLAALPHRCPVIWLDMQDMTNFFFNLERA